jgi:hypothetical protein
MSIGNNWISYIDRKLYNRKIKRYIKQMGYPKIRCQSCGDGYAEWKVYDENGDTNFIYVCNHCVGVFVQACRKVRRLFTEYEMNELEAMKDEP